MFTSHGLLKHIHTRTRTQAQLTLPRPHPGVVYHMRSKQNGLHFAGDNFKCILWNENILIQMSLKSISNDLINNRAALVQIIA